MLSAECRPYAQTAIARLSEMLETGDKTHADLARAIRCVIVLRNRLIDERRAGRDVDPTLTTVNSLLSLGHGAEFPLMGFHRDRIEKMRDGISGLLA